MSLGAGAKLSCMVLTKPFESVEDFLGNPIEMPVCTLGMFKLARSVAELMLDPVSSR